MAFDPTQYGATPIRSPTPSALPVGVRAPSGSAFAATAYGATPVQKQPGLLQGMAQGIAHPFLKGLSSLGTIGNSIAGLGDALIGDTAGAQKRNEAADKINTQGADYGWLGKATPIGAGFDIRKSV